MNDDKKDKELRLLYSLTIDDIRYAKRLQWNLVYYSLLTLGGILAIYKYISSSLEVSHLMKIILLLISITVSSLGIIYIGNLQKSLAKYRERLISIRSYFSTEVEKILGPPPKSYTTFWRNFGGYIIPFWLIIVGACFLVNLAIFLN